MKGVPVSQELPCDFEVGDNVEMISSGLTGIITKIRCESVDAGGMWYGIDIKHFDTNQTTGPWEPSEIRKIESTVEPSSPLRPTQQQIDGDHYRKLSIDPVEFSLANDLNCLQFSIVKHATRYPHKGEAVTDLKKVIHYAQIALERQYGILSQVTYQEPT